jgi:omega-amidase
MKDNLKITLVQTPLYWENVDANLAMLEEKIWNNQGSDLIVLPETFTTGFSTNASTLAEFPLGKTFKWMQRMAYQTKSVIVGSYMVRENNHYYNRLVWMQPNGEFDFYNKHHLFSLSGEDLVFEPGKNKIIKEIKGWKICPLICYDLRFPEWCRNSMIGNAADSYAYDLLIFVANWASSRRLAWKTLLQARAIENSCFCIGVNIIGKDGKGLQYAGESGVYSPLGASEISTEEKLIHQVLDKDLLMEYRSKYPFLKDADNAIKPLK